MDEERKLLIQLPLHYDINNKYRTQNYKLIAGHSYGGLLVMRLNRWIWR
ncbi:MAG: hypothetical protein MJK04_36345 [Psychrosphaera sp.]|nr:hypothetical protein [Psychrosphaera sp.]